MGVKVLSLCSEPPTCPACLSGPTGPQSRNVFHFNDSAAAARDRKRAKAKNQKRKHTNTTTRKENNHKTATETANTAATTTMTITKVKFYNDGGGGGSTTSTLDQPSAPASVAALSESARYANALFRLAKPRNKRQLQRMQAAKTLTN